MQTIRQFCTLLLAFLLCTAILSQSAMAAFNEISCDTATGQVNADSGFFDPVQITTDDCEVAKPEHVFSGIVCNYIKILNDVFGKFYCSIQFAMKDALIAVIVIYIAIFGARMLMGTQEVNAGTVLIALLKIGLLVEITENGAYGVGMIYNFFIGLTIDAVNWVFGAITICRDFDTGAFDLSKCAGGSDLKQIFSFIDAKFYGAIMGADDPSVAGIKLENGLFSGNGELVAFILVLLAIMSPLFQMVWGLIWMTLTMFVRSTVSLLMCLTAVAFLISLSPIFISFALFNSTVNIFNSWIRFLISYSIQPMFIFAIFALWVMIISDSMSFINQLTKIMIFQADTKATGAVTSELKDELKFCRMIYGKTPDKVEFRLSPMPLSITQGGPSIIGCCKLTPGPIYACDGSGAIVPIMDLRTSGDPAQLLPPSALLEESGFIFFLAFHFLSLLTISYVFKQMLEIAPQLAQQLSNSRSDAPLGAGFGGGGAGMIGLNSIARGLSGSIGGRASTFTKSADGGSISRLKDSIGKMGVSRPKTSTTKSGV